MLALAALALPANDIADIGAPPGAKSVEAVAINNRGEVLVGVPYEDASAPEIQGRGFLWRSGRFLDFGAPRSSQIKDLSTTQPKALNDFSVAVGVEGTGMPVFMSGLTDVYPFIWRGSRKDDLGSGWASYPHAINNLGDVVGGGDRRGFARLRGKVWEIGTFSHVPAGNFSAAADVNDHRLIVGHSTYGGGSGNAGGLRTRPFTIDGNRLPLRLRPVPLPKGYADGYAHALNDVGTILAVAENGPRQGSLPYLVRRGRVVPLPLPVAGMSVASAVMNEREEIVATIRDSFDQRRGRPALWRGGKWAFLPSFPGWTLQTATGINDKGQVCGTGLHDGRTRAFVLTPR